MGNVTIAPPYLFSVFDRDVIAIRLSDGAQVWHTHLDHENLSVFDQVIVQDGIVVVQLSPAPCSFGCPGSVPRIIALDGATGKVYWQQDAPGAQLVVGPTPS
jgi:outer membrane protein assembly factor BamB